MGAGKCGDRVWCGKVWGDAGEGPLQVWTGDAGRKVSCVEKCDSLQPRETSFESTCVGVSGNNVLQQGVGVINCNS